MLCTTLPLWFWIFLPAIYAQTSPDACYNFILTSSDYFRSVNYTKQFWDFETCESQNTTSSWYGFANGENVPTSAPSPGQCGTNSPIWFDGSYPENFGEENQVTACLVNEYSTCAESWTVTVKNCGGYNIAFLEPVEFCGTYCMEPGARWNFNDTFYPSQGPGADWNYTGTYDPCMYAFETASDTNRTPEWELMPGDQEGCDDIIEGWYRYEYYENVPTSPVTKGQCGSSNPVWFQGTYPTNGKETNMTACMAGDSSTCEDSWTVKVKNCYDMYNVAYLTPLTKCGRICKDSSPGWNYNDTADPNLGPGQGWNYNDTIYPSQGPGPEWNYTGTYDPCMYAFETASDSNRTPEWELMPGDQEGCDDIIEGWYRYEYYENVPTSPVTKGQCGSSNPVWFQGTYPTNGKETNMTACMAGDSSNCEDSWTVKVKNCYDMFNVAYLTPLTKCGRICKDSSPGWNYNDTADPNLGPGQGWNYNDTIYPSQGPGPEWNYTGTYDPCMYAFETASDSNRTPEWELMPGDQEGCDDIIEGWYRYEYYENVPTSPVTKGQCGSSNPVWFQGTYPTNGKETNMTACMAGDSSNCEDSWTVKVKNCYDMYNVAYLTPLTKCGRICKDSSLGWNYNDTTDPSLGPDQGWNYNDTIYPSQGPGQESNYTGTYDPCMYAFETASDTNRTPEWELMPGDQEGCDDIIEGWYRYEYYENVPTSPVTKGQCGSSNPVWFQGTYPTNGRETNMTACMAGDSSNCEDSWTVKVKNCYDMYNVAYLTPLTKCGRICKESGAVWNYNYTIDPSAGPGTGWNFNDTIDPSAGPGPGWNYNDTIDPSAGPGPGWNFNDTIDPSAGPGPGWNFNDTIDPSAGPGPGWNYNDTIDPSAGPGPGWNYNDTIDPSAGPGPGWNFNDTIDPSAGPGPGWNFNDTIGPSAGPGPGWNYNDTIDPSAGPGPGSNYNGSFDPCVYAFETPSDSNRTPEWDLKPGDNEVCDDINAGWYRYENYENVPTSPVTKGQCGSSNPVWFQGTYPTNDRETNMTACMAGDSSNCEDSWTVKVKNCYDMYNVAYLTPLTKCGRICKEGSQTSDAPDGHTDFPNPSVGYPGVGDETTTPTAFDPCSNSTIIPSENNRLTNTMVNASVAEVCDDVSDQWYRYSGGQKVPSVAPSVGGCTSRAPIWFNGTYPNDGVETTMTACMVGNTSPCEHKWAVRVKNCPGFYTARLQTLPKCGRFCMEGSQTTDAPGTHTDFPNPSMGYPGVGDEPTTPTAFDPCSNSTIIPSENNRLTNTMVNASVAEVCDDVSDQWYRYSGGQKVPSVAPSVGGCTSRAPIWFNGTYPNDGMETTMTACMVGNMSSCEHKWAVRVKSCPGFYTARLQTLPKCGRFCMESGLPLLDDLKKQYEIYVEPEVPSFTPNTDDNQLMFTCKHRTKQPDAISLDGYSLDIKWDINGTQVAFKEAIAVANKDTEGRLKSTEWNSGTTKMGFNVKCSIKLHGTTDYMHSEDFFAGMQVYSKDITVSSGETAEIYYKSTVPVACIHGTSTDCKLSVELVDFTEEYTSGSPEYCSSTFTDLTKPSLCGLDLDGWKTGEWQKLDVKLPANVANDQEYRATMKLRVANSQYDALWQNFDLPEVKINVVNQNVTDDFWWWNRDCFTGSDPWYFTFDWEWFGFHDEGEFVLFKHKTKPIEVHTIQRRFSSWHSWTEHCAVAIRAGSDVFILYGCGRPTKWIQRRIGCSTGKEYLEVYERWGEYEIALPTGTRINVWIASNRMLNIYITLSMADRNSIEGLCGNGNGLWSDDFTGKDGVQYSDALTFARTYRVPESESLFIKSSRDNKLSQTKLFCACAGVSRTAESSNEDCSWKETIPVCPPANWKRISCPVRTKRSTDGSTDDDDDLDYTPVHKEHVDTTMVWKNGWNETSATKACDDYFAKSALYNQCTELSNVNTSTSSELCVRNIRVSGSDSFLQDGLKMMTTKCTSEIRTNNTVYSQESTGGQKIGQLVSNSDCPNECKHEGVKRGNCVNGQCSCNSNRAGKDCSGNTTIPPQPVKDFTTESFCEKCSKISIFASNIYIDSPMCKVCEAKEVDGEVVANGTCTTSQGTLEGMGSVECPLTSSSRRRRRSADQSSSVSYYLISVSNDGTSYSDTVPIVSYDTSCYQCTYTNSTVSCVLRSDICVVNGVCYSSSHSSCSTDDSSSGSKAWIAGVAIALLFILVIIIVILVYKFKVLKLKSSNRRAVSPEIPYEASPEFLEKYEIWDRPGSATPLPPVDTTALYR